MGRHVVDGGGEGAGAGLCFRSSGRGGGPFRRAHRYQAGPGKSTNTAAAEAGSGAGNHAASRTSRVHPGNRHGPKYRTTRRRLPLAGGDAPNGTPPAPKGGIRCQRRDLRELYGRRPNEAPGHEQRVRRGCRAPRGRVPSGDPTVSDACTSRARHARTRGKRCAGERYAVGRAMSTISRICGPAGAAAPSRRRAARSPAPPRPGGKTPRTRPVPPSTRCAARRRS